MKQTCAAAKLVAIIPTNSPTLLTSTSGNVAAISGKYGEIEFNAVCSAKLIIARMTNCLVGIGVSTALLPPLSERSEDEAEAMSPWEGELSFEWKGGQPRDDGGAIAVGKVW
jgi:hypothetical protein